MVVCVLFAFPLTGAATNPARWFGPVFWEWMLPERNWNPWADLFVYLAGPILGALAAGALVLGAINPALRRARLPAPAGGGDVVTAEAQAPA